MFPAPTTRTRIFVESVIAGGIFLVTDGSPVGGADVFQFQFAPAFRQRIGNSPSKAAISRPRPHRLRMVVPGVQLQGGCRAHCGERSFHHIANRELPCSLALGNKDDSPARLQNRFNSHCDRQLWAEILRPSKEPRVILNGLLREGLDPGHRSQAGCGLVEPDMAIRPHTQYLQVDTPRVFESFAS